MSSDLRTPIICVDPAGASTFGTFNPNLWTDRSRAIIQSCASEFAVLLYTTSRIQQICETSDTLCLPYVETLRMQWRSAPWDSTRVVYFGQVPELHVLIEGYFAGLKSMLDLLVSMLSTEGIVGVQLHGFHRDKGVYGGTVINALTQNVKKGKEHMASAIRTLVVEHKDGWIDSVIGSRDLLVHPTGGMQQLMFELLLSQEGAELAYHGAKPPHVGDVPIERFARKTTDSMRQLAIDFLAKLRVAA